MPHHYLEMSSHDLWAFGRRVFELMVDFTDMLHLLLEQLPAIERKNYQDILGLYSNDF